MSNIYQSDLLRLAEIIESVYEQFVASDSEGQAKLDAMRISIVARIQSLTISDCVWTCLGRFLDAELDSQTPGVLAPGRLAGNSPRFGGFHRDVVSKLSETDRAKLRSAIRVHMLCGYVFAELVMGVSKVAEPLPLARDLYEGQWIQLYYSNTFAVEPDPSTKLGEFSSLWHQATCKKIHDTIVDLGGDWTYTDRLLCTTFFQAGLRLRHLIAIPLSETDVANLVTNGQFGLAVAREAAGTTTSSKGCFTVLLGICTAIGLILYTKVFQL